jgi:hypothetical protein
MDRVNKPQKKSSHKERSLPKTLFRRCFELVEKNGTGPQQLHLKLHRPTSWALCKPDSDQDYSWLEPREQDDPVIRIIKQIIEEVAREDFWVWVRQLEQRRLNNLHPTSTH